MSAVKKRTEVKWEKSCASYPIKTGLLWKKFILLKNMFALIHKKNIQGGIVDREGTIPMASVLYYCKDCEQGVRIGYKVTETSKQRVCKKCGIVLDQE